MTITKERLDELERDGTYDLPTAELDELLRVYRAAIERDEKTKPTPAPPAPCFVCNSTDNISRYAITVDGVPLHFQFDLCSTDSVHYLLKVGEALGRMRP